ncbi:MAG TPA: DNA recombination protein RmuC [Brevundimonas sp.]|jgi:DNA recombination protein RmuC|uniref:DNA recombination protein RmuC n=1 Tax=Brevundimonas sp. TaxID=1871086 RepID=UPI002DE5F8EE|nr:DNA recombination protein RmuC [Brevundimonas sp.]
MNAEIIVALAAVAAALVAIIIAVAARRGGSTAGLETALTREVDRLRDEMDRKAQMQREEVSAGLSRMSDSLDQRIGALTTNFDTRLGAFAELQTKSSSDLAESQRQRLGETNQAVLKLTETLANQQAEGRKALSEELEKVRAALGDNMEKLRKENEAKLEQMRATVDEKLQATLAERLGENFKMVSERLDTVHRGLGEMQALATGVGDLKRTLGNIKARGSFGEVQLGALLDDMLTPEQYGRQVRVRPGTAEAVDYAVFLPGRDEGSRLLLPIDCKYPAADYELLMGAQELGDPAAVDSAAKGLEKAIRIQAKSIRDKYVHPPETTPFAILYLPTEGLFAEVIRRPGLAAALSADFSVTVTGPTTLAATLNSLKMGFQTLAIQKNAGDIAKVLGMAKSEFQKYGAVWEQLGRQLDTARKTVDEAGRRTRAVERQLRSVEVVADGRQETSLLDAAVDADPAG